MKQAGEKDWAPGGDKGDWGGAIVIGTCSISDRDCMVELQLKLNPKLLVISLVFQ